MKRKREEDRKAYLRKARELHPDRNPNADREERKRLEEQFKEMSSAYHNPLNPESCMEEASIEGVAVGRSYKRVRKWHGETNNNNPILTICKEGRYKDHFIEVDKNKFFAILHFMSQGYEIPVRESDEFPSSVEYLMADRGAGIDYNLRTIALLLYCSKELRDIYEDREQIADSSEDVRSITYHEDSSSPGRSIIKYEIGCTDLSTRKIGIADSYQNFGRKLYSRPDMDGAAKCIDDLLNVLEKGSKDAREKLFFGVDPLEILEDIKKKQNSTQSRSR